VTERPELHAVYVISVFAELAGVHPQTLRNYERGGLLNPQRTSGGSRRFSDEDLVALRRIQELTNEGVNLEGVKRIMALEIELTGAKEALSALSDEARASIEQTRRQYRRDLVPVQNTLSILIKPSRRSPDAH
jgi:MerR family transcriptional regulator/heat shock protein HspR